MEDANVVLSVVLCNYTSTLICIYIAQNNLYNVVTVCEDFNVGTALRWPQKF